MVKYLEFSEFLGLGFTGMTEGQFNDSLLRAQSVIDALTMGHYNVYSLADDENLLRVQYFKQAVANQVAHEVEKSGVNGLLRNGASVKVGRITVNSQTRAGEREETKGAPNSVLSLLFLTGLMFRGGGRSV